MDITITPIDPDDPGVIKGEVINAVPGDEILEGSSLRFLLSGRPLSGPLGFPLCALRWDSRSVWNCEGLLQAELIDHTGTVCVRSSEKRIRIVNGDAMVTTTVPKANDAVSGIVDWKLSIQTSQTLQNTMFFVDGYLLDNSADPAQTSTRFDTRQLANGRHELFASAYASPTPEAIPQPVGMSQFSLIVDNGQSVQDVRLPWRRLYLHPGEQTTLSPELQCVDGTLTSFNGAVEYVSSDENVATLADSIVTAHEPGVAAVIMTAQTEGRSFQSTNVNLGCRQPPGCAPRPRWRDLASLRSASIHLRENAFLPHYS